MGLLPAIFCLRTSLRRDCGGRRVCPCQMAWYHRRHFLSILVRCLFRLWTGCLTKVAYNHHVNLRSITSRHRHQFTTRSIPNTKAPAGYLIGGRWGTTTRKNSQCRPVDRWTRCVITSFRSDRRGPLRCSPGRTSIWNRVDECPLTTLGLASCLVCRRPHFFQPCELPLPHHRTASSDHSSHGFDIIVSVHLSCLLQRDRQN